MPLLTTRASGSELPRTRLVHDLNALLRQKRTGPVGLVGPGGNGKTWLARRAEADTACFVDAVGARTRRDFVRVLADELAEGTLKDADAAVDVLARQLGGRLVVIDNCEQAVDEARWLVDRLASAGARVAYTSRVALECADEVVLAVDALELDEAIALFLERSDPRTVDPDKDHDTLCALVNCVGRSPLGVEILAGHTLVARPAQILSRLDQRLDLADITADRPPRQASLQAVVQSSLELAGPEAADALRLLGAIRGPWAIEDASTLEISSGTVTTLVRWSLVKREEIDEVVWLRVPERIRTALSVGPSRSERERLARWVVADTVGLYGKLTTSERPAAISGISRRFHELRAAAHDQELPAPLRLRAGVIAGLYLSARHAGECARFLEPLRDLPPEPLEAWGRMLLIRTQNLRRSGDPEGAAAALELGLQRFEGHPFRGLLLAEKGYQFFAGTRRSESLPLLREGVAILEEADRPELLAAALLQLGIGLRVNHHYDEAVDTLERAASLSQRLDRTALRIMALCQIGTMDARVDVERAQALFREALALAEANNEENHRNLVLGFHASRMLTEDEFESAADVIERACAGIRRAGQERTPSNLESGLALRRSEHLPPEEARQLLQDDLSRVRGIDVRVYEGALIVAIGATHHREGNLETAVERYRQGREVARKLDRSGDQDMARQLLALAHAELGEDDPEGEPDDPVIAAAAHALRTGQTAALREALDGAERASWYAHRIPRTMAKRVLEREQPWVFRTDARAFRPPVGDVIDLGRRGAPRRILGALVEQRVATPGSALAGETLIEAGWPDQRILPDAAQARLYSAIRTLRTLGLEELVQTTDDGYRLDPTAPVQVAAEV